MISLQEQGPLYLHRTLSDSGYFQFCVCVCGHDALWVRMLRLTRKSISEKGAAFCVYHGAK
jgi:hypothetical protein